MAVDRSLRAFRELRSLRYVHCVGYCSYVRCVTSVALRTLYALRWVETRLEE